MRVHVKHQSAAASRNWSSGCLFQGMEITAALFLPIAASIQAATPSAGVLFTAALNEATGTDPAEPSAWTLLNPIVTPEESGIPLPEPAEAREEPEPSEEVTFVPSQLPILAPKPPLQFQSLSKELTDVVKKLPLEAAAVDSGRDYQAMGGEEAIVDKAVATPEQKPKSAPDPQYAAFTARVLKPSSLPDDATPGLTAKPLRRPMPTASVPDLHIAKPDADAEHLTAERPIAFVHAPQLIESQKAAENAQPVQSTSASAPVSEPLDFRSTEPVRRISLDVEGVEGQLRVHIAERAGEMRAWVAGHTPATVEKVQAGLSDLTRALTNAGFESEVWAPHFVSAPASASDLHTSTEQSDQNLFGGSHSDTGDNHRGGNQDNRRSRGDDDDDEFNFRSHLRIS